MLDQHSCVDVVCGMLLSTALYYMVNLSEVPDPAAKLEKMMRR